MDQWRSYCILCKAQVSCFAACSAVTGYLLAPAADPLHVTVLALGVLLLAAGASALNQYQERDIDARMDRTSARPLPAGDLSPRTAVIVSATLIVTGSLLLALLGWDSAAMGVFTLLWYNGLYTPLKRVTAFAAVPGALVGVIPPVLGWTAGGGSMNDSKVLALSGLFFLWQVPHFWLLLAGHRDAYERAGLPHIIRVFPGQRHARLIFLWTASASVACLGLPLFGLTTTAAIAGLLVVLSCWMTAVNVRLLRTDAGPATARSLFRSSTAFLALIMVLLSLDAMLRRGR